MVEPHTEIEDLGRNVTVRESNAEQALRILGILVGEWTVEAKAPDGQAWPGEGKASFEWHPSNVFLVQRTVIDVPGAPDSTAIIGCDAENGTYVQLYRDERGVCRIYDMRLTNEKWALERTGAPFAQRFIGQIDPAGRTISGRWEKAESGSDLDFSVDFYLTYRRVTT